MVPNIQKILPREIPIMLRSQVDRYGFSRVLANRLQLIHTPRSFANWVHGWAWWDEHSSESQGFSKLRKKTKIIVTNECERQAFNNEGFVNVVSGGLPFAYINQQHTHRNNHALLAFPSHSAEVESMSSDLSDYLNYLESIKKDFDGIYVSIYSLDWNGPIHTAALKRGLNVIKGANPSDANGLLRVRSILDGFLQVTSNSIGSHMLYALYSGCNFSFCGPFYSHEESVFLSKGNPHGHTPQYIEKFMMYSSEPYVRANFGKFFFSHPRLGVADQEFATIEIGVKHILNNQQLLDTLGWSFIGQIKGYLNGGARRFLR
jgi:hypothetical protein